MMAKPSTKSTLTPDDRAAAIRLKRLWDDAVARSKTTVGSVKLTQESAGADLGMNQSAVSQYLLGYIPLNYMAVLGFARLLGVDPASIRSDLPEQNFSVAEPGAGYAPQSQSLRIDPATIAAATRLVRLTFENLSVEFDSEEDGTPIALAYEYLLARQQRVVTPENLVDFSKKLAERLREKTDAQRDDGTRSASEGDRRSREVRKTK
jgi:transcriptional regulator with XRE-family HTH domain